MNNVCRGANHTAAVVCDPLAVAPYDDVDAAAPPLGASPPHEGAMRADLSVGTFTALLSSSAPAAVDAPGLLRSQGRKSRRGSYDGVSARGISMAPKEAY